MDSPLPVSAHPRSTASRPRVLFALSLLSFASACRPDPGPDTEGDADTDADTDTDTDTDTDDTGCDGSGSDALTLYADDDSDTYGDLGASITSCEAVSGYVENDDDCDDGDASVHPGATEVCDDLDTDEDCDGAADDADPDVDPATSALVYADGDADGYGEATDGGLHCNVPKGFSFITGDCDDTRADVSPDAYDVCDDGFDQDCSGTDRVCGWVGDLTVSDAWATFEGVGLGERFGYSVVAAGDVNGDGAPDLAIGSQSAKSYLFLAPPEESVDRTGAEAAFTSDDGGPGAYGYTSGAGDADGDGYADLVISHLEHADAGAAFLVPGPLTGEVDFEAEATASFVGDSANGLFGYGLAAADLDGDGSQDFVIGAQNVDDYAGAAYVFYGPITSGDRGPADADAAVLGTWHSGGGETYGGLTGSTLIADGDLDGDGVTDLFVGSPGDGRGTATVLYGPITGVQTQDEGDLMVGTSAWGAFVGHTGSIGSDFDGDGANDLVVGIIAVDGGLALFYADSIAGASKLDTEDPDGTIVAGEEIEFGAAFDAGDFDADGADDLVAGACYSDDFDGTVFGFYGPVSGALTPTDDASFVVTAEGGESLLGMDITFLGDFTGNGTDDIAIGAPFASPEDVHEAGAAYVLAVGPR